MSSPIHPGTEIGPYEVIDRLGSGAIGAVYRARHLPLQRDVALKVLSPSLAGDPELVERFGQEAKRAASLQHPHILAIYDAGSVDGWHYTAMQLLEGNTLRELPLPLEPLPAATITLQVCQALAYAHQREVIHLDLKPANVLLNDGGNVLLADFGTAQALNSSALPIGSVVGTPEFMSPEQARGEPASAASDIYSLGLLLWFLLVGRSPFAAENALAAMYRQVHEPLPPLPERIPTPLQAWIRRCTARESGDRYPSGKEALEALLEAVTAFPEVPGNRDLLQASSAATLLRPTLRPSQTNAPGVLLQSASIIACPSSLQATQIRKPAAPSQPSRISPEGGEEKWLNGLDLGYIRTEKRNSLNAALAWGLSRCHSEADRALFPALTAVLGEFNATIIPVEHQPQELPLVDFRITLSRTDAMGMPQRLRFGIVSEHKRAPAHQEEPDQEGPRWLSVSSQDCCQWPWETAAAVLGKLLAAAAGE